MRLANVDGRAAVVRDGRVVDVARASGGRLPSDPMELIASLDGVGDLDVPDDAPALEDVRLGPPVPRPQKILAVGLNYLSHAQESDLTPPDEPVVFAKLPSALCGPADDIVMPPNRSRVDWEAELALVVGRPVRRAGEQDAAAAIAGFTVINDVTMRDWQYRTTQWLQGKTFEATTPLGPELVTPDEAGTGLELTCAVDGEVVQTANTSDMVFGAVATIAYVSTILTLRPGDVIALGTPGGVGHARKPPRYLAPGQVLTTSIAGLGECRNTCVAEKSA